MRTQIITAKLKLLHTAEQANQFSELSLTYTNALNYVSKVAFNDLKKSSNNKTIQKATYETLRSKYKLGSQMSCTACRTVASTFKGLWTKFKAHKYLAMTGKTKKRYKGLLKPPVYKSSMIELQYGRDYSWTKHNTISIVTLNGRLHIGYEGWNKHVDLIKNGINCGTAKLWLDKQTKQWYLLVAIEITAPNIDDQSLSNVKGVDVGQRNLFVSTDINNNTTFRNGGKETNILKHYQTVKHELNSKGTRSAKKRIVAIATRERRFRRNLSHVLANDILENNTIIGMENLTGIQNRTHKNVAKKQSNKVKDVAYIHNTWAYYQIKTYVEYKTIWLNSAIISVNPFNTSKACSKCGYVSSDNRPNGAVIFQCKACGYKIHSDKNASNNILKLTILDRHRLFGMGCLSTIPYVSDVIDNSVIKSAQIEHPFFS